MPPYPKSLNLSQKSDVVLHTIKRNLLILLIVAMTPFTAGAESRNFNKIALSQIPSESNTGYGYRLEYYVSAPIEVFWRFKTDFNSDILLTSKELIGHRMVETSGNAVITENRYASAPGLRFLWKTTVIAEKYRMEFELLNAEDCRHEFHYGSIQLAPAGDYTKVTQIAYFDFTGASLWVKYPWYGGMKYTLTGVAKWEQGIASQYVRKYMVASTK